jgi:hypothetical protein
MRLTDRLLVEVALLFIGLTKFSLTKSGFNHPSVIESPLIGAAYEVQYECAEIGQRVSLLILR